MEQPPPTPSNIPWKRVLIEGVVIVASILLAFAIDAWWDRQTTAGETHQALRAIEAELVENLAYFESAEDVYRVAAQGGADLLHLTGPEVSVADGEQVSYLIGEMWRRPDLDPPSTGASAAMVSTGAAARVRSRALRQELALWPAYIERQQELMLQAGTENLFHQRMLHFIAQLDFDRINGMAAWPEVRAAFTELVPTESQFESDWAGLLADRQFESGVTGRTMLTLSGAELAARTQTRIEELLALIREELRR
ncbi:MAG: hypothetical protein HKN04_02305 [Rhodothermaceae bacterium]|nr:hypothetical protein [Rhodothermaceae bacterium]